MLPMIGIDHDLRVRAHSAELIVIYREPGARGTPGLINHSGRAVLASDRRRPAKQVSAALGGFEHRAGLADPAVALDAAVQLGSLSSCATSAGCMAASCQ